MTEPLKYFNTIYPFDKNLISKIVIGEKYVGIMLKNGQIGVCSTLKNRVVFDITNTHQIDLNDLNHRIIYNAWLNALLNYHNNYKSDKDIFEAIDFSKNGHIVMIGYFRPLVKKFQEVNLPLKIFDLYANDAFVQPLINQEQELRSADSVILTSTSIFNNTFLDIICKTKRNCKIFLLGPSSILHSDMFLYRNITNIFGAVFKQDDNHILEIISRGDGTRKFLPIGRKVYI
ncbi:MAG: hypothetical protein IMY70_01130 [Bacteroidetes bacterium]|nr:hypothetical protein [Bacteroidota bacterium]